MVHAEVVLVEDMAGLLEVVIEYIKSSRTVAVQWGFVRSNNTSSRSS